MPTKVKKVFLASDHAGVTLKAHLVTLLNKEFPAIEIADLGPSETSSVDYPDFAKKLGVEVGQGKGLGILVCGSGIGMCISANKLAGVRAASVWDVTTARLCRQHNNANVVCLGARLTGPEVAEDIVRTFISTEFLGGRHEARVSKITLLEQKG